MALPFSFFQLQLPLLAHSGPWLKSNKKILDSSRSHVVECRFSGMEAPDDVACLSENKWRRKPGGAGLEAINTALQSPFLISLTSAQQ